MTNITKAPATVSSVVDAWLSHDADNPTMCVNISKEALSYLESFGVINLDKGAGSGIEGHINTQLPVGGSDSQVYLGGDMMDDFDNLADEALEFVLDLLEDAEAKVNWRSEEHYGMFGTKNIEQHDNGLEHGYYDGSNLALLENLDTGEAYITLSLSPQESDYYKSAFKVFESLADAKQFIKDNIHYGETLQDFSITHRIWKQIKGDKNEHRRI